MRIEWLAAALNPRDVAPHPNFISQEEVTEPGLLALLAQLRLSDYDRLVAQASNASGGRGATELRMVSAVRNSLDARAMTEGIDELQALIASELEDDAAAVTAALFVSTALAERDRHAEAVRILESVIDRLPISGTADQRFARAIGLQQLSLRRSELGLPSSDQAEATLTLTSGIRVSQLSRFRTSRSVRWRSSRTCSLVISQLRAVADAHLVNLNRDLSSRDWTRLVRSPAPELDLMARRSAASGLSRYVQELFEAQTRSNSRTLFAADPVESDVYKALLHFELVGAGPAAQAWRGVLGRLRILRQVSPNRLWSVQDGIRLLRQAEDLKSLDLALRYVRAGGPLQALAGDVRQIIAERVEPQRLGRAELTTLSAGAHLLAQDEASLALSGVLATLRTQDRSVTRRWEAPSVRSEAGWGSAVALAGPAGRLDEVAQALLVASRSADQQDELLVRALSRAAAEIEWDGVTETTRSEWAEWLADPNSDTPRTMEELVGPEVGVSAPSGADHLSGIDLAATLLNHYFRTEEIPDLDRLGNAAQGVEQGLRDIRDRADKGAYTLGVISTPDVAAALAVYFGVGQLWNPLVDLLLDPRVSRSDKTAPLERLANSDRTLPDQVVRRLGDGVDELLASPARDPWGGRALTPFPAALRLAAAHSLMSGDRVLAEVARLGGSYGSDGRIEAARTLALLARIEPVADWITAMSLQLSHDEDPLVRGETGRALASLSRRNRRRADLIGQRLLDLLGEDGLIVPLLVLRGLQFDDDSVDLPVAVTRRVARVADDHPAWGVRLQARALIES